MRRYEAVEWMRRTLGVVNARDLPAQPSEEEFRLALRSGSILCHVINKVESGAVPKVIFVTIFCRGNLVVVELTT